MPTTSCPTHPRQRRGRLCRRLAVAGGALALAAPGVAQAVPTTEFTVPSGGSPQGITTGPDGNLWVTVNLAHAVARVTPTGVLTPFDVGYVDNASPEQIVTGPDGALWFTDDFLLGDPARPSAGVIHRVSVDGAVTDFPLPTVAGSQGLTNGPDGALWYTMRDANLVGRITTAGEVREFPLPGAARKPGKIATGSDGALWFTQPATHTIGRLTPEGAYSEFTPPTPNSDPRGITKGPDGAIWFTEFGADRIGRIATDGKITEFPLPGRDAQPQDIITGPDGALWFSEGYNGHVDRLTVLGRFDVYTLPGGGVTDLAAGPEGSIWYTRSTNLVGRLDVLAPPVVGTSVGATPVSGRVLVKRPGANSFTSLGKDGAVVPIGSELDTTGGRVALTAASGTASTVTKTADFYGGRFKLAQQRSADAVLEAKLTGPLVGCSARARSARAAAVKRRGRGLWGDGKGTFRTTGKRSAATVRGTIWQVEDRCDGSSVTTVKQGSVSVRDFARGKTVIVSAGKRYTAKKKG